MLNVTGIARALVVGSALLQLGAAQAETSFRNQLLWGPEADTMTGIDITNNVGGIYVLSKPPYALLTASSSPANNGTADVAFSSDVGAVLVATTIHYTPTLSGPTDALIPVHVIAHGLAEGEGYDPCCGTEQYSAGASFTMFSAEQGYLVYESAVVSTGSLSDAFTFDQVIYIQANTVLDITLTAGAGTTSPYTHTSTITGHAFVDPQFIIDPAYASQYAFIGLPAVLAVPEPASGALLALGGGLIAWMKRRRRRS